MMVRSVFGKMKVEELETWYTENKSQMSNDEKSYVENVIYRKRYNERKWVKSKANAKELEKRLFS
mgnify:CR=1 FL=1